MILQNTHQLFLHLGSDFQKKNSFVGKLIATASESMYIYYLICTSNGIYMYALIVLLFWFLLKRINWEFPNSKLCPKPVPLQRATRSKVQADCRHSRPNRNSPTCEIVRRPVLLPFRKRENRRKYQKRQRVRNQKHGAAD